jgi:nucleotide-binding universal stress UspA family protein
MFERILVPLDGSPLAEQAVPYAEALAEATGAQIILVRAVLAHVFPGVDPSEHQLEVVAEAERYLSAVAAGLGGRQVETGVFYGEPARAILAEVRIRKAQLVVMGTHGRSGLGRWLYGSVADEVLRHAQVPVMLVPSVCEYNWPVRPGGLRRILVPLDGSLHSEEALPPATELARALRAGIVLLRAVEPPARADGAGFTDFAPKAGLEEAGRYLEAVARPLRDAGWKVETRKYLGAADSLIAETAREVGADAIVMATHGHGGLTRLLLGSVAAGVLHRAPAPILLVRPTAARRAEIAPATVVREPVPAEGQVAITFSPHERTLIALGLRELLETTPQDENLATSLQGLLSKLEGRDAPHRRDDVPLRSGQSSSAPPPTSSEKEIER